jgi:hypothetical protein
MTARSVYEGVAGVNGTAHASAEFGGFTPSSLATVAPAQNSTTWSRQSARVALANGTITQSQFVAVMQWITMTEQETVSAAKSVLRNSGDLAPA